MRSSDNFWELSDNLQGLSKELFWYDIDYTYDTYDTDNTDDSDDTNDTDDTWLSEDFLSNFWEPSEDFLRIFQDLSKDFLKTFWGLS